MLFPQSLDDGTLVDTALTVAVIDVAVWLVWKTTVAVVAVCVIEVAVSVL